MSEGLATRARSVPRTSTPYKRVAYARDYCVVWQAVAADGSHAKASYYVGRLLAQGGQLEEALNHLKPLALFLEGNEEHASVLKYVKSEIRKATKQLAKQQSIADRTMAAAMRRSMGSG